MCVPLGAASGALQLWCQRASIDEEIYVIDLMDIFWTLRTGQRVVCAVFRNSLEFVCGWSPWWQRRAGMVRIFRRLKSG
jgi:hypothetical protein